MNIKKARNVMCRPGPTQMYFPCFNFCPYREAVVRRRRRRVCTDSDMLRTRARRCTPVLVGVDIRHRQWIRRPIYVHIPTIPAPCKRACASESKPTCNKEHQT